MKKLVFAMIVILAASGLVFGLSRKPAPPGPESKVLSEKVNSWESTVLTFEDENYVATWTLVEPSSVELIANFENKKIASEVFAEHECRALINAGFYKIEDGKNAPIGLFSAQNEELSPYTENRLFNGILSVNSLQTPRITREVPEDIAKFAFQTGPLLIENSEVLKLNLVNDKPARRMLAAVTGENDLLFISVTLEDSSLSGPWLIDLPQLVDDLNEKNNLNIADAVNLDGGAASAFMVDTFSLSEITPIGSFLCAR